MHGDTMFSRREFTDLLWFAALARAERVPSDTFVFSARGVTGFMNTDGKTGIMRASGTG